MLIILIGSMVGKAMASSSIDESSPTFSLPFGDVNVFIVTDVHSYVAGKGRHEAPLYDANYGHVLSFYELMKEQNPLKDIFFVMNGDFMDGTGLCTYPPSHLVPILEYMPWDAINIGNHELYRNSTIEYMTTVKSSLYNKTFIEFWDGAYITSNVVLRENKQPIGSRFRFLHGKHSTILTFGFA